MPDPASTSVHHRFLSLWDSEAPSPASTPLSSPPPASLSTPSSRPPASSAGKSAPSDTWGAPSFRRALDKIKIRGGAVDEAMRAMLSPFDIPMPAAGPAASLVPSSSAPLWRGPRSSPLSHLTFAEGPRLLMTQTLSTGSFGKFRLGVWEDDRGGSADHPLVALKELRLATAPSWWQAFAPQQTKTLATPPHVAKEEINQLAAAHSPMALHDVVAHGDKLYLSLPLLEMDLLAAHRRLAASGGLDDAAARERLGLRVMHDVASALTPMHAAHVVHRDIKPENLFLDAEGRVRVGDVGLAHELTPKQPFFVGAAGTGPYMAPEVAAGEPSALPADAWSTSVAALNLLLGAEMFVGPAESGHAATAAAYRAFHAALPRQADGTIDIRDALRQQSSPYWSRTFRALAEVSAPLATFMLNRGLHPDPRQRATLAEQQAFAAHELRLAGTDPDAPEPLLQGAAEDTALHHRWRTLLLVYRDALLQSERAKRPTQWPPVAPVGDEAKSEKI